MSGERPIILVGAGRMGGAMLAGWLVSGHDPRSIVVLEPHPSDDQALITPGLEVVRTVDDVERRPAAVLVLAVKPQSMGEVLPAVAPLCDEETIVVSIAAGITLAALKQLPAQKIVRAMPNTPAALGKGMTAAYGHGLDEADRRMATELLEAIGRVAWLNEEAQIDVATGVSGSGPAYVFALVESLAAAGVAHGLAADVAMALARQTVVGAGALLERSALEAEELRRNVTSPGGTTAAGLDVLQGDDALDALIRRTVEAATRRSQELGR